MRKKIISNLLSSGVEKFFIIGVQFISSIILIRLLPRDDYGVIGIVVGYFAFVSIINISLESIILRDHKKFDDKLDQVMQEFFMFNVYKTLFFILVASSLSYVLSGMFQNNGFIYAIWSITFIMIADSITAPFVIYFTSKFNQKLVTKISVLRAFIGLTLLLGLFMYPNLWYVALKDFIVSSLFIGVWFYLAMRKISFNPKIKIPNLLFIKESLFTYSLWTHLNGVVTNFIYKSDTFFLSFVVGLTVIGNYNIALNSANIANILPMILGYQNSVALSHVRNQEDAFKISNAFIKLSLLIGVLTLLVFYIFGEYYLYIITGEKENPEIFFYMMCIVIGLVIVKTFASPLVSYIMINSSIKKMVFHVSIPLSILTFISYFFAGFYFQARGIALANILIALIWLILLFIHLESIQKNLTKNLIWRVE